MLAHLLKCLTWGALRVAVVFGLVVASTQSARAQTVTVLYSFEDSGGDGGFPDSGVVLDAQGNVYGETLAGGKRGCYEEGCGTLFSVTPGGVETILYTFPSNAKSYPTGGLIWDAEGNLYGTARGALHGRRVDGGVFELKPGGNLEWIFVFNNQGFGENPAGGVTMDPQGNLYGTTIDGGMSDVGAVFELKQNGLRIKRLEDTLYSFTGGNDGDSPGSRLILDGQGNLYGTTPLAAAPAVMNATDVERSLN